jgi:hypothetical protein
MAQAMMIDSQAVVQFWGEVVSTAVNLHQRSLNEGLKKKTIHHGYQVPYNMQHHELHGFGQSMPDVNGNNIMFEGTLRNLG